MKNVNIIEEQMEKVNKLIKQYKEVKNVFLNKNRLIIYNIVQNKRCCISDIMRLTNISYRNTFNHVKRLERCGLIKCTKDHATQGRKVYLSPTNIKYEEALTIIINKLKNRIIVI